MEQLKQRQLGERLEIEDAHLMEFNQFNEEWDKKMVEYQEKAEQNEIAFCEKQQKEIDEFRENFMQNWPENPRPNKEVLDLKRVCDVLAKRKEYTEAHKVQQRALELERTDMQK